jgi:hypothetical protein
MATAWGQNKDIYRLMNDLKFKSSQEFTDDIWGRWAFVVSPPASVVPYSIPDFQSLAVETC